MSQLADTQRTARQQWAMPGGLHDRLVRIAKNVLPVAVGALVAFLAAAPFTTQNEVSFVLDKKGVDVASERMKVKEALYRGTDSKGRPFSLRAGSAVQKTSRDPIVEMQDLSARLMMNEGAAVLKADRGRYNMDQERMSIVGPVQFDSAQKYRLTTRDVDIDLKTRSMESNGPVYGRIPMGPFNANHLEADLNARTVTLVGNARLRIEQNALKGR
ncbi:MAG: LPS export ABC transporter periplasmic protein LptC [Sphingobium sp.]|nr:LPS export ABC transporter periplasmic protein LptC [Sphingobium sp.]